MGSVFSHHSTNADRSASDRRRHKEKIEKAIKDGVKDIVAEESIIGKDGKKKIKIPVKGIKEYKFVFQKELAINIKTKFTPKIMFFLDDTFIEADKINTLLSKERVKKDL